MVWKLLKQKSSITKSETTPPNEHDLLSHFTAEFSPPDPFISLMGSLLSVLCCVGLGTVLL
jgi:hypothetical protein